MRNNLILSKSYPVAAVIDLNIFNVYYYYLLLLLLLLTFYDENLSQHWMGEDKKLVGLVEIS